MLKETGLVTKVEKGVAWVNTQNKLACSSCKVESSCGNGILEKYLAGKIFISKLENSISAKVGDQVIIGIPKSSVSKASILVYGMPLFGLLLGALIGHFSIQSELTSILLAFVGLLGGLALVNRVSKKMQSNDNYRAKLLSKIERQASDDFDLLNLSIIKSTTID